MYNRVVLKANCQKKALAQKKMSPCRSVSAYLAICPVLILLYAFVNAPVSFSNAPFYYTLHCCMAVLISLVFALFFRAQVTLSAFCRTFIFGAVIGAGMSIYLREQVIVRLLARFPSLAQSKWVGLSNVVIFAPFLEEVFKLGALLVLVKVSDFPAKNKVTTMKQWIVLGAAVGFGFMVIENFGYFGLLFANPTVPREIVVAAWFRNLMSLHPMCTALAATIIAEDVFSENGGKSTMGTILKGVGLPFMLHAAHNFGAVAVVARWIPAIPQLGDMYSALAYAGAVDLIILATLIVNLRRKQTGLIC